MTLTRKQCALREEVSDLVSFLKFTTDLTGVDSNLRTSHLTLTKRQLVVAAVVQHYLLIDEHLNNEMCWEFFRKRTYPQLWKTKRFRAFNNHILDRLTLLNKLAFVRTRIPISNAFCERIEKLNSLRNAVAHSFFPENRKTKPKWKGADIFTIEGYSEFFHDMHEISQFFFKRLHRQERQRGQRRTTKSIQQLLPK